MFRRSTDGGGVNELRELAGSGSGAVRTLKPSDNGVGTKSIGYGPSLVCGSNHHQFTVRFVSKVVKSTRGLT